jgi:peroxiredoxin
MSLVHKFLRRFGWEEPLSHIEVGQIAPEFSLKSMDSKEYSLAQLRKKGPVVLAFYKVSCPVCQFTFPFLQRLAEHYAGNSASVVAISQDDVRSTKDFNHEYGVNFLTLLDDHGYPVSNAYGLTSVPTIFLVAPDGKLKVSGTGFSKADLETIAAELAQQQKTSAASAAFFRPDEAVPAFKPG